MIAAVMATAVARATAAATATVTAAAAATATAAGSGEALGAALAAVSAFAYDVGYIVEKKALAGSVIAGARISVVLAGAIRSKLWLAGFATMLGALALQLVALTLAPVSVVQPILAGGLVALAAASSALIGEHLDGRHKAALAMVLVAVAAVAFSARGSRGGVAHVSAAAMVAVMLVGVLVAVGSVLRSGGRYRAVSASGSRPGRDGAAAERHRLVSLAVAAGVLYGLGALAEKAVASRLSESGVVAGAFSSLGTPYPWLFLVATAGGLVAFQAGLAEYPVSLMASLTNAASTVCALVGARIVFGDAILARGGWALLRAGGLAIGVVAVGLLWVRPGHLSRQGQGRRE